jgi:hypothetical protein
MKRLTLPPPQKACLQKLLAEMVCDRPEPIRMFKGLAFKTEATFNDQVKDRHGHTHDLLVMAYYVHTRDSPCGDNCLASVSS